MTKILVTGGAKGVGAAIVRALATAGHDVDFTYRASGEQALALAAEIAAAHPGRAIQALPLDLADKAALDAFCEDRESESYFGLVHNAGQPYDSLAAMMAQDKAEAAMQVNFWAFTRLAKSLMRSMIRARAGRIVAIGSVAALRGNPGNAAYAASKGALISYAKTLAVETGKRGVTVNVIAPGFVDTTAMNPFDVEKAKKLLAEAGVKTPLELRLQLPPPSYARQGGEVIAAQLAQVGIVAKIQNVEWAQWISGTYGNKNYDLSVILHVEPFDLVNYTRPEYYWGYQSAKFNEVFEKSRNAPREADRLRLLGEAQRILAEDSANVFLYQPQLITIAARGLRGLWKDAPIFANDIAAMSWA